MKCKWFSVCPLRKYEQEGVIDGSFRTKYCEGNFLSCKRFQLEEKNIAHPDNLMPDGSYL